MIREDSLPLLEAELNTIQKRSVLYARPGFLIRRLHQIHSGLFLEETSEFNITPVQYSLLSALLEQGELDQISLAMEIGLERTTVAEVLPRLEARGLLERRQSPLDGRVKLVRIARKGRALVQRMQDAVKRAHDRTIEALAPAERQLFMLMMIRLVESSDVPGVAPLRHR
ncbi:MULTISPECIES: MarR family winged helix-turn-helix transcriptional regulator [unclassified Cupriavidus]|uniref:MarR family winged helix-turn-helix transcriptional regulator n=1 Tax=Cupriavidus sp. H19C3 TaxID=3241603 RepID=UPI0011DC0188|nr:MAG: MarR family transcriptional regulator [Cupriavidus sp.]